MLPKEFKHPYTINPKYKKSVAYFSMEFAIDQSLKIYSGGLGFLAGSHMRSAYDLKQNLIGIGILWKYGYYDQFKKEDRSMGVLFQEKVYHFLVDTGIKYTIQINNHDVWVKAFYLPPDTFGSAPLFLLSTDLPENDYLGRSTTDRLYDSDPHAKIAQSMVLGIGGAKLLEMMNHEPDVYHLNEAHGLSAMFQMYSKDKDVQKVKDKFVFTTHTPEEAGNEKHDIELLKQLSFFKDIPLEKIREITGIEGSEFNHTLAGLRLSHNANGVSKLHGEVSRDMWKEAKNISKIGHITNAQNKKYWADAWLEEARLEKNDTKFLARKKRLKHKLFDVVADQTGKLFNPDVLTIVWARRFAEYKRADLITRDLEKFQKMIESTEFPVQIIFAGKPYPTDYNAIRMYNNLVDMSRTYANMAVLAGYELKLSRQLKEGADIWLNNPRVTREASGTSGMTAAMNGAINFSTNDGWVREFDEMFKERNSFVLPTVSHLIPNFEQDEKDLHNMYEMLNKEIIPMYYKKPQDWLKMVSTGMEQVAPFFDSDRMADEYYTILYK